MFLIVTRNFPPDLGGMQMLMGGLSESLLDYGQVKVFTYEYPNSKAYDDKSSIIIEEKVIENPKFLLIFLVKSFLVKFFVYINQKYSWFNQPSISIK